jgi:hypothetical protein
MFRIPQKARKLKSPVGKSEKTKERASKRHFT